MSRVRITNKSLFISSYLSSVRVHTDRLIQAADVAVELRDSSALLNISSALCKAGLDVAGSFYLAIAENRSQGVSEARRAILEDISEHTAPLFRAKALIALGNIQFEKGDFCAARKRYDEAQSLCSDPLIRLHTAQMNAIISGCDGDHKSAAAVLLNTLPLASSKGIHGLNHRNSLAVELNALGRVDEARYYLQPCLSSPYRIYYPEWSDTAREVYSPSRSQVYIPSVKISARVTATHPRALMSKITEMDKWRDAKKPAKPPLEDYLNSGRFKLYSAATQDDKLTEAHWDALYSIYTKFTEHLPEQPVLDNVLKAVDEELRGGQQQ